MVDFSLYFHIPFCTRKCDYCHFYVLPDKDPFKQLLMEGLEMEWQQKLPLLKNKKLSSIYFGGGTPALLGAQSIAKILSWINASGFHFSNEVEVTLEANPENITTGLMSEYAQAGINRISIGLQTLDDALLRRLNRLHTGNQALEAIYNTYNARITNISVDLMYDLPGQTLPIWTNTLEQVCNLPITHLSLYNLTIEPHTVFFKNRKELQPSLPDEEVSLRMYEKAIESLHTCGLQQYEISAFSRSGFISKHNTGYWTARPFLGLGPSAFSDWEGKRFRNVPNLNRYYAALKEGASPIDFEEKLDPDARRRELFAINIRLLEGIHLGTFEARHGKLEPQTNKALEKLQVDGFLSLNNNRLRLTKQGILFYDTVATELI